MLSPRVESAQRVQAVYRNRNLQVLFGATLVSVLSVSGVAPAYPKIVRALEISSQQVGGLITAYTVPGIVLTPGLGAFADRVDRKRVLTVALAVFALVGASCALACDFVTLLMLRVLRGVGLGGQPFVILIITLPMVGLVAWKLDIPTDRVTASPRGVPIRLHRSGRYFVSPR